MMDKIRREGMMLLAVLLIALVGFRIVFYNESMLVIARVVASIAWLFILPGFAILYYWHEKLEFAERLIAAVPLSTVLVAIPSYYLGLLGLHIMYHGILLPLIVIAIGAVLAYRKEK